MKGSMAAWAVVMAAVPGVYVAAALEPQRPGVSARAGEGPQRVVVPWSDPARPGLVKVQILNGSITVRGYDGKDVIVEVAEAARNETARRDREGRPGGTDTSGLRRIANTGLGLTVEEENNEMRVSAQTVGEGASLSLQVPRRTSLKLSTINDGAILVENVEGEIEANNINGPVTLKGVAGTVVAHALNDDLIVTMTRVGDKPMSFSSLNGDIDVTLPADIKADVRLETVSGEILTDFDLVLQSAPVKPTVEERGGGRTRYRVKLERVMRGTINGGGPELSFKNFNGDIRIRKQK